MPDIDNSLREAVDVMGWSNLLQLSMAMAVVLVDFVLTLLPQWLYMLWPESQH